MIEPDVIAIALLIAGVVSLRSWLKMKAKEWHDEMHKEKIKMLLMAQNEVMRHNKRQIELLILG